MKLHQHRHIVLPMLLVIAAFLPLSAVKAQADSAYWNARFLQLLRWTYVDSSLAAIYLPYELEVMSNESGDTHTKLQTKNYTPIRWYGYRFQPSDQWPVVFQVAIGDGPEQTLTLPALEQLAQWGAFLTNDDHRRLRITRRQERDESLRQDTLLRRQLDSLDCIARALRIEADSIQASMTADSLEAASRKRAEEILQAKQRMNRDQIFILNVKTARSEYMFGLEINLYNPFGRTISMLEFNVAPYNDRGQVQEDKFHRTVRTMRCMGPIAPESPAQYTFDELFWNDRGRIKFMRINSITFHFTDGTTRSFRGYENILKHTLR